MEIQPTRGDKDVEILAPSSPAGEDVKGAAVKKLDTERPHVQLRLWGRVQQKWERVHTECCT